MGGASLVSELVRTFITLVSDVGLNPFQLYLKVRNVHQVAYFVDEVVVCTRTPFAGYHIYGPSTVSFDDYLVNFVLSSV